MLVASAARALLAALFLSLTLLPSAAATAKPQPGKAEFLIDMGTGKVLKSENADVRNHPASLTKMLTIYLTLEAVHDGRLTWKSRIPISKAAAATPAFKFALPEGATFTVREAVEGMIVISANDAAQSMCDYFAAQAHKTCGQVMTAKAHELGMSRSEFVDGSGLSAVGQLTTARDMATLAQHLIRDFPEDYKLFSKKYFTFRSMKLRGHNSLMYSYQGMDGLKTGFIDEAGYNLVSSAKRDGRRLVGVVLGGKSGADRANKMAAMMDAAFANQEQSKALMALAPTPADTGKAAVSKSLGGTTGADEAAKILSSSLSQSASHSLSADQPPVSLRSPEPKPAHSSDAAQQAAAEPTPDLTAQAPDPLSTRSVWEVQVAAVDREDAALSLLADARSVLSKQFSEVKPITETVSRGSLTLFRARLTGFDSKEEASEACRQLLENTRSCFVVGSKA